MKSAGARIVYLSTWINFGKYRDNPNNLQGIIDSGIDGLKWVKWLMENSHNFEAHEMVTDYIAKKEIEYGCILQPEGSK